VARWHEGGRAARAPGGGTKELACQMLEVNTNDLPCTRPRFEHRLLLLQVGDADSGTASSPVEQGAAELAQAAAEKQGAWRSSRRWGCPRASHGALPCTAHGPRQQAAQ
jgi:hypothetical protein